jgi:hypothetical protein
MSTRVRSAFAILLFCTLLPARRWEGAETQLPLAPIALMDVRGQAEYRPNLNAEWRPARLGQTLEGGGQLRTLDESWAAVHLADGTILRLAPRTTLTLRGLETGLRSPFAHLGHLIGVIFGGRADQELQTPSNSASVRG